MVLCSLKIMTAPEQRQEVLSILRHTLGPTAVQPGCISCHLFIDVEDDSVIVLMEEWESPSTLECHLRSQQYRDVLAAMECSIERPDIRFSTVSQTAGLELIEAARHPTGKATRQ